MTSFNRENSAMPLVRRTEHSEELARVQVEAAPRGAQLLVRGHVLAHVELGLRAERVEHADAAPEIAPVVQYMYLYSTVET